jgi:hypothetical protein
MTNSIRGLKSHIKELTGYEPPTCPWRVFYDPLVSEVVDRANKSREIGAAAFDDHPAAIIYDAFSVYTHARNKTQAYDDNERRKRLEAERRNKPQR